MKKILSVFIALVFSITALLSQTTQLITYNGDLTGDLTASCQSRYNHWDTLAHNDSMYFVTIEDIATVQQGGRVRFTLPGVTDTIYATAVSVIEKKDSTQVWSGVVDCYEGNVLLVTKDSITTGYINYLDETYTISRLCDDYVVLITHDSAHVATNCGNVDSTSSSLNNENTNSSNNGANQLRGPEPPDICCESTVLVLYTNKAKTVSDPEGKAVVMVENLNQALRNSQVCHAVRHVGTEQISWPESIGDHRGDIEKIQLDPQAQLLRNQYSADIVMVLIGHDYQIGFGRIYGISSADNGYTITSIVSPSGRHVFPHEWSHELGADHHDVQSGFARGYIFSNGRTIMVNGVANNELHFSNPDIDFNGSATGVVDERDNARQMDNTGCTISQYRSNNSTCEDFVVFIDGPPVVEAGTTYSWCSIPPDCGSEPAYAWEYSYDGFFWQNGGFTNCMTLTTGTQNVHVRLTVICNNGCSSTGHFFSLNSDGILGEDCLENALVKQGKRRIHSSTALVYPNPATNTLNIQWDIHKSEDQVFDITIHNAFGQSYSVGSFEKSQLLNWSYDVSNYQNGNYYITLVSKNEYAIAKVLVRH